MSEKKFIDRQEIARLLEVSKRTVERNEENLGLLPAKVRINDRFVRYHRDMAISEMQKRGLFPKHGI